MEKWARSGTAIHYQLQHHLHRTDDSVSFTKPNTLYKTGFQSFIKMVLKSSNITSLENIMLIEQRLERAHASPQSYNVHVLIVYVQSNIQDETDTCIYLKFGLWQTLIFVIGTE